MRILKSVERAVTCGKTISSLKWLIEKAESRCHTVSQAFWCSLRSPSAVCHCLDTGREISQPFTYSLFQNYPNPFNPTTTISYQLPEKAFVSVKVFDVIGNEIETLIQEYKPSGVHEVSFDGSNFSSGIYLYQIDVGDYHQSKKMILIK